MVSWAGKGAPVVAAFLCLEGRTRACDRQGNVGFLIAASKQARLPPVNRFLRQGFMRGSRFEDPGVSRRDPAGHLHLDVLSDLGAMGRVGMCVSLFLRRGDCAWTDQTACWGHMPVAEPGSKPKAGPPHPHPAATVLLWLPGFSRVDPRESRAPKSKT